GQGLRVRPAGQQHLFTGVPRAIDVDTGATGERAGPFDKLDLPGLEQALETLVHAVDDAVLVLVHADHVHAVETGIDAERAGFLGGVGDLRGVQQGLRGDAPAVQAGAADLVLLDEGDGHAEFGSPERRGV